MHGARLGSAIERTGRSDYEKAGTQIVTVVNGVQLLIVGTGRVCLRYRVRCRELGMVLTDASWTRQGRAEP